MIERTRHTLILATLLSFTKTTLEQSYSFTEVEPARQRSDYWLSNYEVLDPDVDPRARRAHEIFERVHNAAGSLPGVETRLLVIGSDPFGTPRAETLPDGGIIVTKGVLDICYKDERYGDDRLAFVLAHEIAHQLNRDYWHYQFFGALDAEERKTSTNKAALKQVREIAKQTDVVRTKELEADVSAIGFVTMAGFDPHAIVSDGEQTNFFVFWANTLDPAKLVDADGDHSTPEVRAAAVIARLNEVTDRTDYFRLGVLFYQAGKYCEAADAFSGFLQQFPSREVYHNLAACHHQLGIKETGDMLVGEYGDTLRFKLSFPIDSQTLANLENRGSRSGSRSRHMESAIAMYNRAIESDPDYPLPYIGLGCAYLLIGELHEGVAKLQNALKRSPSSLEAMNNLGVAFYLVGHRQKAESLLLEARRMDSSYDAPLLNLGTIALAEGNEDLSREYFAAYLQVDSTSTWSEWVVTDLDSNAPSHFAGVTVGEPSRETIAGARPNIKLSRIPSEWGAPLSQRRAQMESGACGEFPRNYRILTFASGVLVVADEDKADDPWIEIVATLPECRATSNEGVRIGSTCKEVEAMYGLPLRRIRTPQGEFWVYDDDERNVSFMMRDGVVESWAAF